jgi:hypothetical protein
MVASHRRLYELWISRRFFPLDRAVWYPNLRPRPVDRHEPLGIGYRTNRYFRDFDTPGRCLEVPEVRRHFERIREVLKNGPYIETGWPCLSALPMFIEQLGGDVRIVHLTRDPVPVALSLCSHGFFVDTTDNEAFKEFGELHPGAANVRQMEYAERWPLISPYEKGLFQWTEINLYADELRERYPDTPIFRIQFEDLFQSAGKPEALFSRFLDFAGLPPRQAFWGMATKRADKLTHRRSWDFNPDLVFDHANTVELARRLGYELSNRLNMGRKLLLRWRYRKNFISSISRRIRKMAAKLSGRIPG